MFQVSISKVEDEEKQQQKAQTDQIGNRTREVQLNTDQMADLRKCQRLFWTQRHYHIGYWTVMEGLHFVACMAPVRKGLSILHSFMVPTSMW